MLESLYFGEICDLKDCSFSSCQSVVYSVVVVQGYWMGVVGCFRLAAGRKEVLDC